MRVYRFIAMMLAAAGGALPLAAAEQKHADPILAKVTGIRDRFVAAVKACGVEPAFVPAVSISTKGRVISYSNKTLIIGRWEELSRQSQEMFEAWAAHETTGRDARLLFNHLFNGFLVGHELGHWVGDWSGRLATLDRWDGELEANRFAIAFATLDPTTAAGLKKTVSEFAFIRNGAGPVPRGEDERQYFNANYKTLDLDDYGWFQGRLTQLAWEQRKDANFCALVKLPPMEPGG